MTEEIYYDVNSRLRQSLRDVKNIYSFEPATKILSFNTSDLDDSTKMGNKIFKRIKHDSNVVYIFKLKKLFDLKSKVHDVKQNSVGLKLPKINKDSDNKILYVGSVKQDFKTRIRQHLGFGSNSTYSLQLKKWVVKEKIDFVIEYFVLENIQSDLTLSLFESTIAKELKPQLGKH
jgi:hypothetical protein